MVGGVLRIICFFIVVLLVFIRVIVVFCGCDFLGGKNREKKNMFGGGVFVVF